ncbi:MAG: H(+)/Cl(-) exchange transporter ClcA [Syntrophus sp. PtaB.Bin138]|jgi:H+/Cl- antiporter ClcA|nr:MAG: H(+)/Cl(-) exchange transporter ClcA [Syntrophus sp. PtaB.Bin138]
MKEHLIEESILFISILKWVAIATGIGIIVGLSTTFFLKILEWALAYSTGYPYYFLMLPVGLAVSALTTQYLEPDAKGYGIEKVIEAVHRRGGRIKAAIVPVKLLTAILTIATGGSAGQVGPCGQIGASLASVAAELFRLDERDRKKIVVCGLSAGFATVLGAPFAGAIFGVEVLYVGGIVYEILLPSIIAGITGYHIALLFGIHYQFYPFDFAPALTEAFILKIVFSGIFFGICSLLVIEILKKGNAFSQKFGTFLPLRGLIGGAFLIGMTLIFSKQFLGTGLETIQTALRGEEIIFYAFLVKAIFTSITLNFGGSGGLVMPILCIGATAGNLFGDLFGLDRATFAAVGFVSLLAGTTNTPIASSILAVEFFGSAISPYAAIACIVSFLMTGHRSVFPTQVLSFQKSTSVHVAIGTELEQIRTSPQLRDKSLTGLLLRILKKIKDGIRKRPHSGEPDP